MEKVDGKVAMGARQRPRKRRNTDLEGHGESGVLATGQPEPILASPPQELFSTPTHHPPVHSRYLTRSKKALLDQCASSFTPFRQAVRNIKGMPSHCSMMPARNRMGLAKTIDRPSPGIQDIITSEKFTSELHLHTQVLDSPAASSRTTSQPMAPSHSSTPRLEKRGNITDNLCNSMSEGLEDWSIPLSNDIHAWEKFKSKLFPQTQGPEKECPTDLPCASQVVIFDHQFPIMEANFALDITGNRLEESANTCNQKDEHPSLSLSLNLTKMAEILDDNSSDPDEVVSAFDSALVTVNGYRVKPDLAPLLRDIFSKHNDIAKGSSLQSMKTRSSLLEMVCGICQQLQDTEFTHITTLELKSMLDIVGDLESVNVEVGWLHRRLEEVSEATQFFKGSSTLKEAKTKNTEAIARKEKELEVLHWKVSATENELAALKSEAEKINETVSDTKAKVRRFYQRSLVDGLF